MTPSLNRTEVEPAGLRALAPLLALLRERHGDAVVAILLYGSCLRSGDFHDGLVDLYVIVAGYRHSGQSAGRTLGNWLLPPNVYYAEVSDGDRSLRSKYALISRADFQRGLSARSFESYFWGRFCQPVALVYAREQECPGNGAPKYGDLLRADQELAATTLLSRALPLLPPTGLLSELWQQSLALSYGTELRAEQGGRPRELAIWGESFYRDLSQRIAARLPHGFRLVERADGLGYAATIPSGARLRARIAWRLRALHGKVHSLLRLTKALFTFAGGLDYLAWKLARHSGQPVLIPDKVRRHPLVYGWAFFWRLHRRGLFK
ncbi:MAG: hypothetical protein AB7I68_02595 [Porticoccaceae bacterium]